MDVHSQVALVQFLVIQEGPVFSRYRSVSREAVNEVGGKRSHEVHVDQVMAGGEMPYRTITIDTFPSGQCALNAFDQVDDERQAVLSEIYALLVRPRAGFPRIAKTSGFLAPILSRWLGTYREKEMPSFAVQANPGTGPIPETVEAMRKHDQSSPFYMMNLNKYFPKARYKDQQDVSGEQAYNRYASRIAPYLVSVGGYPSIIGPILGAFIGDNNSQLHDDWCDFAMVYYPSRRHFIRMMSNSPVKGVYHREAGLQRAVLMPCTSYSNNAL